MELPVPLIVNVSLITVVLVKASVSLLVSTVDTLATIVTRTASADLENARMMGIVKPIAELRESIVRG